MMLNEVAEIIARTINCKIDDIKPETDLASLGVDSLKALTVIFELEEAFDIEIPNEVIPSIVTVNDIISRLQEAR